MNTSRIRPTQAEHDAADYRHVDPSDVRAGMWFNLPDSIGPIWFRVIKQVDNWTWLSDDGRSIPVEICSRVLNADNLIPTREQMTLSQNAKDGYE